MFRTPSGQIGRDAYTYELAAISNARRSLDRRMSALVDNITAELPASATSKHTLGVDGFTLPIDADTIRRMVDMLRGCDDWSLTALGEIIKHLDTGE